MPEYFCRIITEDHSDQTEERILSFFRDKLGIIDSSPIQPYWKMPEHGEITCRISTGHTLEDIQRLLADRWDADIADIRRSNIFCPGAVFLWIC